MRTRRTWWVALKLGAIVSSSLWISACGTSGIQLRDFAVSTSSRIFWQSVGTLIQAEIIGSQNP